MTPEEREAVIRRRNEFVELLRLGGALCEHTSASWATGITCMDCIREERERAIRAHGEAAYRRGLEDAARLEDEEAETQRRAERLARDVAKGMEPGMGRGAARMAADLCHDRAVQAKLKATQIRALADKAGREG